MKPFSPPKRKLFDLLGLVIISGVFYLLYPSIDAVILFILGFIWNWSVSIDLSLLFENRRYRFSMLKTVIGIQQAALKPFENMPLFVRKFVAILPAGIFWTVVIFINDSVMPWWATFIGSLAFELIQIELKFAKGQKETL